MFLGVRVMTWMQAILHTIKVFVLFVVCTLFFYFGLIWINQEYENFHRYDQPEGNAVEVSTDSEHSSVHERLRLFYKTGE